MQPSSGAQPPSESWITRLHMLLDFGDLSLLEQELHRFGAVEGASELEQKQVIAAMSRLDAWKDIKMAWDRTFQMLVERPHTVDVLRSTLQRQRKYPREAHQR